MWTPGWGGINAELRRQFEDEVERSRTLEATRERQAMAIADLEKEVANLRIARYSGKLPTVRTTKSLPIMTTATMP